jgi:hypothetical protein
MTLETVWKYRIWRSQNPHVATAVRLRAEAQRAEGQRRGSVWENADLRFKQHFRISSCEKWKIPNDFWALISRDVIRHSAHLGLFFEIRDLKQFSESRIEALLTCNAEAFMAEYSKDVSVSLPLFEDASKGERK